MLVKFVHGQSHGPSEEGPGGQRYETMQCFALTQPRAMMEEGEGKSRTQVLTLKKKNVIALLMALERKLTYVWLVSDGTSMKTQAFTFKNNEHAHLPTYTLCLGIET